MCSSLYPTEQEMSRAPLNINQNKGRGGHRLHDDWGSDTQELQQEQRRVRDSENGSKGKLNNNKKSYRQTRTQQQRSVTYDNAENYYAYHSHSHSSFPAVFCDNIVQECVVLSETLMSLETNTIQRL